MDKILEAANICEEETDAYAYGGFEHNGSVYIYLTESNTLDDEEPLCYAEVKDGKIQRYLGFTDVIRASVEDPTWEKDESAMIIFGK